jgi:2-polyprenyl-6-hydroxyphenyl methylase/3-demethylubiquinone-9 3-methyltransferase
MSIGRAVRTRLGRFEAPVSDFYRRRFIDLDACADAIREHVAAAAILEVGCGDGQMASRLLARFPDSSYQGIDVAPEVGRLFEGDARRARFRSIDSGTFLRETSERFDLVVVVDVLHHVSQDERGALLADVRELTAPGGHYALKDWVSSRSPIQAAVWASDRLLTGDRVRYFRPSELEALIPSLFPADRLVSVSHVPPNDNNLLLVYRRSAGGSSS